MIRFHIGAHPTRNHDRGAGARASDALGSLGIEVDGVDISGGRLEDRLVPTIATLVEAIARLVEGAARTAAVPFDEGSIELIIARHGDAVSLSLVSLPRPARVLVRDLEVDLDALAAAAADCGAELLAGVGEADAGSVSRLRQACARLARTMARPGAPLPAGGLPLSLRSRPPAGGSEAPAFGFDLRDEDGRLGSYEGGEGLHPLLAPGHLYVHAPDGEELCAVAGSPFLLLRDLADVGLRLLEARREGDEDTFLFPLGWEAPRVEVDLRGGAVTVAGRTLRCPPEALARSLFTAALDLGGTLLARNPRLAKNPYLGSLMEEARERLALCDQLAGPRMARQPVDARAPRPRPAPEAPPLAPGTLRRISLRVAWRSQVGPIRRLHHAGAQLWAIGRYESTVVALADGSASAPIRGSVATAGATAPLLLAGSEGGLRCLESDGADRVALPADVDSIAPRFVQLPRGRAALVANGASLRLLDLGPGEEVLVLDPPAASSIHLAAAGSLLAAGADNGVLYGLHAGRAEIAWRVPVGGPIQRLSVLRDRILVQTSAELACFAAPTGEEIFRCALPLDPVGELLPVSGGWVLAGAGRAGGELLCIGVSGEVKWRARPNLGAAPPSLLRVGPALYARGESGVCRIERGKVRWNVPCAAGGAPALVRGVLALPGEALALLDAATGRALQITGNLADLPPADHLFATDEGLVVADREGAIAAVRLAGALAVVR